MRINELPYFLAKLLYDSGEAVASSPESLFLQYLAARLDEGMSELGAEILKSGDAATAPSSDWSSDMDEGQFPVYGKLVGELAQSAAPGQVQIQIGQDSSLIPTDLTPTGTLYLFTGQRPDGSQWMGLVPTSLIVDFDGPNVWTQVPVLDDFLAFSGVAIQSPTSWYLISDSRRAIQFTTNGGQTWSRQNFTGTFHAGGFDIHNGVMYSAGQGAVWKREGESWTKISDIQVVKGGITT